MNFAGNLIFNQAIFLKWSKSHDKNLNILRTSLNILIFLEGESPILSKTRDCILVILTKEGPNTDIFEIFRETPSWIFTE